MCVGGWVMVADPGPRLSLRCSSNDRFHSNSGPVKFPLMGNDPDRSQSAQGRWAPWYGPCRLIFLPGTGHGPTLPGTDSLKER
jgi:hypothetical protein